MSAVINTNMAALGAQRTTLKSSADLATSMQRLSTGMRINSAKDDAAGLAISERMTSQLRGQSVAARNANDGVSAVQSADAAIDTMTAGMSRLRELAIQGANGSLSAADRASIGQEVTAMTQEVDRIAGSAEFNGRKLLDGTGGSLDLQVGASAGKDSTISVKLEDLTTQALGIKDLKVDSAANSRAAIDAIDSALEKVSAASGRLGAAQTRFAVSISNLQSGIETMSGARARIRDADFATETANLSRSQLLNQAGTAMLSQANKLPQGILSLLRG